MTGTADSDIIQITGAALACAACGLDAAAFSGVCDSSGGIHDWGLRAAGDGEVVAILPPAFGSRGDSDGARDKYLRADGGGVWQSAGDARRNGYDTGFDEGYDRGRSDGDREGYERGRLEGRAEAVAEMRDMLNDLQRG